MTIGTLLHRAGVAVAVAALIASTAAALVSPRRADAEHARVAPPPEPSPVASEAQPPSPPTRARPELTGSLNLNTASERQLQLLPGIGATKAERIVAWRKRHGRFARIKDLRRVKGFGRKTVRKLAPFLTLTGENTLQKDAK